MKRCGRRTCEAGHSREERTAKFLMYLGSLANVSKNSVVVSSQTRLFLFFCRKKRKDSRWQDKLLKDNKF